MTEPQLSREIIDSASSKAREMLESALDKLKETTLTDSSLEPRMFFPNGIELIDINVTVAPISVHLQVAGEKGVKEKLPEADWEPGDEHFPEEMF